ncbi:MAG: heavy metal sensor histidine kinase [Nitrospiria bacterium]
MAIRIKLALWYGILLTVVLVLLAGIHHATLKQMLHNQKDYSLKVIASILDASIPRRPSSTAAFQKAVARLVTDYPDIELKGLIIEVYDRSRSLVFSSSLSEGERLPLTEEMWGDGLHKEAHLQTVSLGNDTAPIRLLTKPVFNQNDLLYLIQVGSSMQDIETTLDNFLLLNFLFIPTAALLVAMGGWLLARQAFKPLGNVIKTAHGISSGDLSHRIESSQASEEIRDLATAFNQMIARLESSFQQIRDFTDNVSHELRIPLAILKGQTELSLRRLRSEEEYRQVLDSNLEEIQRMEKIVERLLFLSRADRGEIQLSYGEIDLLGLIENVSSQFQVLAREKNIRIKLSANGPVSIVGDELLLRELLLNLVQNAMNYTLEGGEVTLSLERGDAQIQISVADTGCGIPENEIPRIFDRFHQVDKSRSSQGSGLGLSICKWIVQAHQGKINVVSTVGRGSQFTVAFPSKIREI